MPDDSIPPTIPEGSSGQTPSKKKPGDNGTNNPANDVASADGNEGTKAKSTIFGLIVFLIIEAIAWILWQFADGLHDWALITVHCLSSVCLSAGPLPLLLEATNVKDEVLKASKRTMLWCVYGIVWIALLGGSWFIWRPSPVSPLPHFRLMLITQDSLGQNLLPLDITNNCAKVKKGDLIFGKILAVLNVPIPPEIGLKFTNVTTFLNFQLFNDTPADVKCPELGFSWVSSKARVRVTDGWRGSIPDKHVTDSIVLQPPPDCMALHFDASAIPPIKVDSIDFHSEGGAFGDAIVNIKGINELDISYAFAIVFVLDTNMSAYITEVTNTSWPGSNPINVHLPPRPLN